MSSYLKLINRQKVVYGLLCVAAAGAVWYMYLRPAPVLQEILVLEEKPFLQQVSVSGKVVAAKEVALGFSQSGRITSVSAKVGSRVAQGSVLAVVENGDLRATLLQREAALENQEAKLASLKAGTRPEELAVAQSAVQSDSSALIDKLQDAYRAADAAVHNTLDQFINNPRTAPVLTFNVTDTNLKTATETKRLAAEAALNIWGSSVFGLSGASDLSAAAADAQITLAAVVSLLSDANSSLNRAIPSTQIPQATLDTYSASVATARTAVNSSISAVTTARAALEASKKNWALKAAGSTAQDILAQEAQVKAARADVVAAQAQVQKTVITAPFGGIITSVDAKVGKIVSPNTPEVSMISGGAFQIESYVPEVNIALIQVGNKATVTLDAYGANAPFPATVLSIDPASTLRDGVSTYRIVLEFLDTDDRIKSGMTANVTVTTLEKESTLSVPEGLVEYRDGKHYIRLADGELSREVEVKVGESSSLGYIEILSGLQVGDRVILSKP